jgi:hypothetical protein
MTIAVDTRYRSIRLEWLNNSYRGNELVQLFVRPSGGAWSLAGTFAIAGDDQLTSWDTALPVTLYDVALRYLNQTTPAVGYESTNPDLWTAATAAQSKSTVTTGSAAVAWTSGLYDAVSKNAILTWASAQLGVPYLLEKFVGGVWVTVVSGITANVYVYAVPVGEQGLTVPFRVTAQSGVVSGPTATLNVALVITVGTPILAATPNSTTGAVDCSWTSAFGAVDYLLEKSTDAGVTWFTVLATAALAYSYLPTGGEVNHNINFRVTGRNSGVIGTASNVVTVLAPLAPPGVSQFYFYFQQNPTSGGDGGYNSSANWVVTGLPGGGGYAYSYESSINGGATWQGYEEASGAGFRVLSGTGPKFTGTVNFRCRFHNTAAGTFGPYSAIQSIVN